MVSAAPGLGDYPDSYAVLGAKVKVPTPGGAATVSVPKWSNTGRVLRLKGRGVPRADGSKGDEYIKLMLMLPEKAGFETRRLRRGVAACCVQSAAIHGSVTMEAEESSVDRTSILRH
jgi:DnaJ-class molecular chaperone